MSNHTLVIHAVGCCLVDYLYTGIDFTSNAFSFYAQEGGIVPGKLVFSEDVERALKVPFSEIKRALLKNKSPDTVNLGGPAVVALMHASQLLLGKGEDLETAFWGAMGDDNAGEQLQSFLNHSSITNIHMKKAALPTPNTIVLSDPQYNIHGERAFINTIGAAAELVKNDIPTEFFDADIVLFGGTALVPGIHDSLTSLLRTAKERGCFTVVGTVYDYRNEKRHPERPWSLGEGESYQYIDLLIADEEEACRLTGKKMLDSAISTLIEFGVSAFIITKGAEPVVAYASKTMWKPFYGTLAVCTAITEECIAHPERRGDTTGCGDNYVGGVIADMAYQIREGGPFDIVRAHMVGSASGGYSCFYVGGAFFEKQPGEKLHNILPYMEIHSRELGIALPECWKEDL